MSRILALVHDEPQAAASGVIETMRAGPGPGADGETSWGEAGTSLVHAPLGDGDPGPNAGRPLTLDGRTWIVADARVDDRLTLSAALGLAAIPSDAELILRAHARWGEACVDRLLGDFAFAIWDTEARRLFCARDQLGVKPLYYASGREWFAAASTIDSLRRHPEVGAELDERAVADFLLFGFQQDHERTTFRDIRRLPPAHVLTRADGRTNVRSYWTLPIEAPLDLPRDAEYVERLRAILGDAVRDRLRSATAASVFMSGGIDSTLLAATAVDVLGTGDPLRHPVQGFTFAYGSLIPDTEREPARLAAASLGIPLHAYVTDAARGWVDPSIEGATPEPSGYGDTGIDRRCYREMAAHSHVAFYGEGPDNALVYEWRRYLAYLWRRRRYGRIVADVRRFVTHHRTLPLRGSARAWLRGDSDRQAPDFPAWIDPGFARRLDLYERWAIGHAAYDSPHPVRPRAHASLLAPVWQSVFDSMDPVVTGAALDIRHPYLDLRLLRFLLRVPVIPWCREKHLLRNALAGRVPDAVRRRPKTPLSGHPNLARVRRDGWPPLPSSHTVEAFGSLDAVRRMPRTDGADVEGGLRLIALGHWLERQRGGLT